MVERSGSGGTVGHAPIEEAASHPRAPSAAGRRGGTAGPGHGQRAVRRQRAAPGRSGPRVAGAAGEGPAAVCHDPRVQRLPGSAGAPVRPGVRGSLHRARRRQHRVRRGPGEPPVRRRAPGDAALRGAGARGLRCGAGGARLEVPGREGAVPHRGAARGASCRGSGPSIPRCRPTPGSGRPWRPTCGGPCISSPRLPRGVAAPWPSGAACWSAPSTSSARVTRDSWTCDAAAGAPGLTSSESFRWPAAGGAVPGGRGVRLGAHGF